MAKQYKKDSLALFTPEEWCDLDPAKQDQIRTDYQTVYNTMPEGFDAVLDVSTYPTKGDLGNAELFLAISGCKLFYDPARKLGYIYGPNPANGCTAWNKDPDDIGLKAALGDFSHRINSMLLELDERQATADSTARVKKIKEAMLARYGAYTGASVRRVIDQLHTLTANPAVKMDDVSLTGPLINCPNGILDLRTGQMRDLNPDDYISQGCPTEYHPGARTAEVDAWLASICATPEIRRQLLQVLGAALDASTVTKKMPILYGSSTNNGKTTVTEIIMDVIGKAENGGYGQTISAGALDKGGRTAGKCTPELATVGAARIVVMSEPAENQDVDWAYAKELTGGGSLHVNPKNKPAYTIPARFTLMVDTNYLLRIDDPTLFNRGTIQIVPFLQKFSKELGNLDTGLRERMHKKENREAILAAIVDGYRDFVSNGKQFSDPPEALETLARYKDTSDRLGEFLKSTYIKVEGRDAVRARIPLTDVYADYRQFLEKNGHRNAEGSSAFRRKLESRATVEQYGNAYHLIGYKVRAGSADKINDMDPLTWYMTHCMAEDPDGEVKLSEMVPAYAQAVELLDVRPMDDMGVFMALVRDGYDVSNTGGTMTLRCWRMLTKKEMDDREAKKQKEKQDAHNAEILEKVKAVEDAKLQMALGAIVKAYKGDDNIREALDLLVNGPEAGRLPY